MAHYGFDISSNNVHPIAFGAAYAYLKALGGEQPFCIIKVNQGTGYVNPDIVPDVVGARAAGFAVAGYLMDQGNANVAAEEAVYCANSLGMPQTNDIELPSGLSNAAYIAHSQSLVVQNTSALDYLNQSQEDEGFPVGGGLWEANFNHNPGVTHKPGVWIHQYNNVGTIPGCGGQFDLDFWLATEAQFNAFFGIAVVVPPPVIILPGPTPTPREVSMYIGTIVDQVPHPSGYGGWILTNRGYIYALGNASNLGGNPDSGNDTNFVALVPNKVGDGYILARSDGSLYAYGNITDPGNYNPTWGALGVGANPLSIVGAFPAWGKGATITLIRSDWAGGVPGSYTY